MTLKNLATLSRAEKTKGFWKTFKILLFCSLFAFYGFLNDF